MGFMNNLPNSLTFRLFKKYRTSAFLEGMASVLDATEPKDLYNYEDTPAKADASSIHADWLQVGNDLRSAMHEHASRKTS